MGVAGPVSRKLGAARAALCSISEDSAVAPEGTEAESPGPWFSLQDAAPQTLPSSYSLGIRASQRNHTQLN